MYDAVNKALEKTRVKEEHRQK